jgi:hypothetical protein
LAVENLYRRSQAGRDESSGKRWNSHGGNAADLQSRRQLGVDLSEYLYSRFEGGSIGHPSALDLLYRDPKAAAKGGQLGTSSVCYHQLVTRVSQNRQFFRQGPPADLRVENLAAEFD